MFLTASIFETSSIQYFLSSDPSMRLAHLTERRIPLEPFRANQCYGQVHEEKDTGGGGDVDHD